MDRPVALAVSRRYLMVGMFVAVMIGGLLAFKQLNIEAYPDPTPPMVDIVTQSPGLSSEEIESDYEENTGRVIVEMYGPGGLHPEEAPGALVASHGPFVWGADGGSAVAMASAVELMAELATNTLLINPAQLPLDSALLDRHFTRKHGPMAYYGQP